ncbi:MAG TPA: ABC transporter ATP-binding protein, partial [Albitalea sp.]|nr:ABC transporter ATP-binding protein [Albitalea sp.]
MTQVVLSNINLTRGSTPILRDVDLTVDPGEFCVFVGPSGCGKSTLLRLIAGLEDGASGEITIDGKPIADVPAARRGVAMVFQGYALYPHMTVYDNMAFGLRRAKLAPADIDS